MLCDRRETYQDFIKWLSRSGIFSAWAENALLIPCSGDMNMMSLVINPDGWFGNFEVNGQEFRSDEFWWLELQSENEVGSTAVIRMSPLNSIRLKLMPHLVFTVSGAGIWILVKDLKTLYSGALFKFIPLISQFRNRFFKRHRFIGWLTFRRLICRIVLSLQQRFIRPNTCYTAPNWVWFLQYTSKFLLDRT